MSVTVSIFTAHLSCCTFPECIPKTVYLNTLIYPNLPVFLDSGLMERPRNDGYILRRFQLLLRRHGTSFTGKHYSYHKSLESKASW